MDERKRRQDEQQAQGDARGRAMPSTGSLHEAEAIDTDGPARRPEGGPGDGASPQPTQLNPMP
ncbi:MAG: hypothetical protein AAFZ65_17840 [Planctomycetota bacterium]